uniref:Uncharacterized protein n=1 Tax=Romanomermis culicivorax TaxID=13658 RepID=A0A915JUG0_ROMCU
MLAGQCIVISNARMSPVLLLSAEMEYLTVSMFQLADKYHGAPSSNAASIQYCKDNQRLKSHESFKARNGH